MVGKGGMVSSILSLPSFRFAAERVRRAEAAAEGEAARRALEGDGETPSELAREEEEELGPAPAKADQ